MNMETKVGVTPNVEWHSNIEEHRGFFVATAREQLPANQEWLINYQRKHRNGPLYSEYGFFVDGWVPEPVALPLYLPEPDYLNMLDDVDIPTQSPWTGPRVVTLDPKNMSRAAEQFSPMLDFAQVGR